jgi:hypothetical protein
MYVSGAKINSKLILRICCGISSYPCEYFHFSDFTIFLTSVLVTGVMCIFGKGCLNTAVRNLRTSLQSVDGLAFVFSSGDRK